MSFLDRIFSPKHEDAEDVPSDVTISQVLDAISGGAYADILSNYSIGLRDIRNASMSFPTYFRVITLLSGVMSELMTNGSLSIVDRDGNKVDSENATRVLNFFEHSPDGYTPAQTWFEDLCIDYLVEGNSLCHIVRGVRNRVMSFERLSVWDANTIQATDGSIVYRARFVGHSLTNEYKDVAGMNVLHARWPRTLRHSASSSENRWNFAPPPVRLMRKALEIGLAGDQYIKEWFDGTNKSSIGISLKDRQAIKSLPAISNSITNASKNRKPLIIPTDATFTNLNNNAADTNQDQLREFQVSDVARVYGIPGPIMNQQVTQWGQGIEQLAKLFWKTCIRQHLMRILTPAQFHLLKPGQRFEIDPTDLLRGDITSISALITATRRDAQTDQIATVTEQRKWLGLPKNPEGEELLKATGSEEQDPDGINQPPMDV